ncbi:MAG: hypothetical protein PHQ75_02235 [Thermoguttaceae bacterium]|nr:hypothetical protein [Thermoguttaceae bacterium]
MAFWYYYDESKKKQGPVNDAQLMTLAAKGIVLPETVVEMEGGKQGVAKQIPGLTFSSGAAVPPGSIGSTSVPPAGQGVPPYSPGVPSYGQGIPPHGQGIPSYGQNVPPHGQGVPSYGQGIPPHGQGVPSYGQGIPPHSQNVPSHGQSIPSASNTSTPMPASVPQQSRNVVELLELYYKKFVNTIITEVLLFLLLILGIIACTVFSKIMMEIPDGVKEIIVFASYVSGYALCFALILIPFWIACLWYMFMYLAWSIIPEENARTTPNKAVGYCMIPLFSFYWVFVAYQGLAEGINKSLAARQLAIRASAGKGTVLGVLNCYMWVPYACVVVFGVRVLFQIQYMRSVKDAAIVLALARLNEPKPR